MMKKWTLLFAAIFAAALMLSACSNTDQEDRELPADGNASQQEADGNAEQPADEAESDGREEASDEQPPADPLPELLPEENSGGDASDADASAEPASLPFTIAELSANMAIGMSQEEVIELIGDDYTEVTIAMDNTEGWRYDIGAVDGYSFEETMDMVDIEGMKRGDVPLQIFVSFDSDGKVNGYSGYQVKDDGTISVYQWLENGEMKTDTIL